MKLTAIQAVLKVLSCRKWMTAYEIRDAVCKLKDGTFYADSTITARIRDNRKVRFGGYCIICQQIRINRKARFEYKLFRRRA